MQNLRVNATFEQLNFDKTKFLDVVTCEYVDYYEKHGLNRKDTLYYKISKNNNTYTIKQVKGSKPNDGSWLICTTLTSLFVDLREIEMNLRKRIVKILTSDIFVEFEYHLLPNWIKNSELIQTLREEYDDIIPLDPDRVFEFPKHLDDKIISSVLDNVRFFGITDDKVMFEIFRMMTPINTDELIKLKETFPEIDILDELIYYSKHGSDINAAGYGYINILKYMDERYCDMSRTCIVAAKNGNFEAFKYGRSIGSKFGNMLEIVISGKCLKCIEYYLDYFIKNNYIEYDDIDIWGYIISICDNLDIVKYVYNRGFRIKNIINYFITYDGNYEVFEFLLNQGETGDKTTFDKLVYMDITFIKCYHKHTHEKQQMCSVDASNIFKRGNTEMIDFLYDSGYISSYQIYKYYIDKKDKTSIKNLIYKKIPMTLELGYYTAITKNHSMFYFIIKNSCPIDTQTFRHALDNFYSDGSLLNELGFLLSIGCPFNKVESMQYAISVTDYELVKLLYKYRCKLNTSMYQNFTSTDIIKLDKLLE